MVPTPLRPLQPDGLNESSSQIKNTLSLQMNELFVFLPDGLIRGHRMCSVCYFFSLFLFFFFLI